MYKRNAGWAGVVRRCACAAAASTPFMDAAQGGRLAGMFPINVVCRYVEGSASSRSRTVNASAQLSPHIQWFSRMFLDICEKKPGNNQVNSSSD